MTTATATAATTDKAVEFGPEQFIGNARLYAEHKRIVDAVSRYDNLDDAVAALTDTWDALEKQSKIGGGYTPPVEAGFGSDNAGQIASALIGQRSLVSSTRKAFATVGKAANIAGK